MGEVLEHVASRAQQRLWFVEQLVPGEPLHNINVEGVYAAQLDETALRAAGADVVARHESLRTVFRVRDGELRQVVLDPPEGSPVEFVDLSDRTEADRAEAYEGIRQRFAGTAFALDSAPLLRIAHVRWDGTRDRLFVVVHHMAADALSTNLIFADLDAAYGARATGRAPDRPELPVQYADFTAWQEDRLAEPEARADLDWWRAHLADLPVLDLTHGRPRPAAISYRGSITSVEIDPDRYAAIGGLARGERSTPFMVLLAAYAEAVGRVFGARDVPVSSAVAGRPLPEVADVVGLFVDRVVLRLDTSGRPTFRELLGRARRVVLDAHEHGSVTFDAIVDAVGPERRLGVTPLAQAAINLQPPPSRAARRSMPEPESGDQFSNGTVRHDLILDLADTGTFYRGTLEARAGVVSADAARRVLDQFAAVLTAGLAEPDRPVADTPTMPDEERARLETALDGGPVEPVTGGWPDLVRAWADREPDQVAVTGPTGGLTRSELQARANALAQELRARGVGPETPVLVAVPRGVEFVLAWLAVQVAGGAAVPVDPEAPEPHRAAVARTVGATLSLPGDLPVSLAGPPPADPGPPDGAIRPESAAYVLFTSGSTGPPKGVVVEHRNLIAYTRAILARLAPPPGASHLVLQPPTFDFGLTSVVAALAGGGTVHLADEASARDPGALAAHLAAHPVDYLKITPSHLAALVADADPAPLLPRRAVLLGGEGAGPALLRRLAGVTVITHYGPTETTIGVLAGPLDSTVDGDGTPLGPPLPGVRVRVLDELGRPVPPGVRGELHVAGATVTRGYAGDPKATAAAFVPADGGERTYRTGDLVRIRADGGLEFCGRADRQVKIRGFRVEPAAVEAALEGLPAIARAAVLARDGQLLAWVVPAGGAVDTTAVRAELGRVLPAYSVPNRITALDRLPTTGPGKLDVAALPDPDHNAEDPVVTATPETGTEKALLEVWEQVLGRTGIGVTDGFFAVGGDSIRSIQVVGAARERGLDVSADLLFRAQTIRSVAAQLDAEGPAASTAGPPAEPDRLEYGPARPRDPALAPLDGPAHDAYGTTTVDLLLAAVGYRPGADPGPAVREAKRARLAGEVTAPVRVVPLPPGARLVDPTGPAVILAGDEVLVVGRDDDPATIRAALVELVAHCATTGPVYSAADFPDTGLDEAGLARLLGSMGVDP